MAKASDRNYVSVWFWLLAMIVMAIPIVNVVMAIVWAVSGENQSRKNYFRALILIFVFWTILAVLIITAGLVPFLVDYFRHLK